MNKRNKLIIILVSFAAIFMTIGLLYAFNQVHTMILQGEVEVKSVDLSSKVPGRVKKLYVQKGDKVKKGDVLVELDLPEVNAKAEQVDATVALALAQQEKANNGARAEQIAMAKAGLDVTKKSYERLKRLHDEGVIPTQKLDEVYAKYKVAQETYNMAVNGARVEDKMSAAALVRKAKGGKDEVNSYLKETQIVAPIDGIITEINVDEFELVGSGYPIVTIVDDNDAWVTFNIREDLLTKIKNGTEFDVHIPALGKKPVRVKVNYISAMGDFATWRATKAMGDFDMKTFEVRAVPVEKVEDLRSGMSAVFDWNKLK